MEGPIVCLKLDDGTWLEVPLLHHAVNCGIGKLVTKLIELGVRLESVDNN